MRASKDEEQNDRVQAQLEVPHMCVVTAESRGRAFPPTILGGIVPN